MILSLFVYALAALKANMVASVPEFTNLILSKPGILSHKSFASLYWPSVGVEYWEPFVAFKLTSEIVYKHTTGGI